MSYAGTGSAYLYLHPSTELKVKKFLHEAQADVVALSYDVLIRDMATVSVISILVLQALVGGWQSTK